MKTKALWAGLALLLSACGPIIGSMMVAGTGIQEFRVVSGQLSSLPVGGHLAVLGPFDKTPQAFYICRGEEAADFTSAFNQSGLFAAELAIDTRFPTPLPKALDWRGRSPAAAQSELQLTSPPDLIMSGTILKREMVAAPAEGIIMTVAYRLEFLDLTTGQATVIELTVKELFQNAIPKAVDELLRQRNSQG